MLADGSKEGKDGIYSSAPNTRECLLLNHQEVSRCRYQVERS